MKKFHISKLILFFVNVAIAVHALPPPVPTISGVTFDTASREFTISSSMVDADSCHAVLCTDLTTGLQQVYNDGNATATHEGTAINYGAKSIPIIFGSSSIFFKRNDSRL